MPDPSKYQAQARRSTTSVGKRYGYKSKEDQLWDTAFDLVNPAHAADSAKRMLSDVGKGIGAHKGPSEAELLDWLGLALVAAPGVKEVVRRAAGRVATNVWTPVTYSNRLGDLRQVGAKRLWAAVKKDVPYWELEMRQRMNRQTGQSYTEKELDLLIADMFATERAREFPFRKMFHLKPRHGEEWYRQIGPREYAFTHQPQPKHYGGDPFAAPSARESLRDQIEDVAGYMTQNTVPQHQVMGGYLLKPTKLSPNAKVEKFDYYDRFDWDLFPSERAEMRRQLGVFLKGQRPKPSTRKLNRLKKNFEKRLEARDPSGAIDAERKVIVEQGRLAGWDSRHYDAEGAKHFLEKEGPSYLMREVGSWLTDPIVTRGRVAVPYKFYSKGWSAETNAANWKRMNP